MNAMPGIEPREPAYAWGQRVIALDDLVNDGSYPERPVDAMLAARGSVGEIVNGGHARDFMLHRLERALRERVRYRYVQPRVLREGESFRIQSPCCSRNVDPS